MPPAVAPFPWFGGKDRLAKRISALLPAHRAYVEVFGGSGAVLFAKEPSKLEVYNDIDGGVVSFFRVLRDQPEDLAEALTLTPYSRAEYLACRESWGEVGLDDIERARRWFVTTWQAFGGGGMAGHRTGWATDVRGRKNGSRPRTFAWRVDRLCEFAGRLRTVQIEQRDWRELLDRYDSDSTCFYLDPPYLPETRRSGTYAHELTLADHQELVEKIQGLSAAVVLSGYASPLYEALTGPFERFEFNVHLAAAKVLDEERQRRLEVVWRRGPFDDRALFGGIAA